MSSEACVPSVAISFGIYNKTEYFTGRRLVISFVVRYERFELYPRFFIEQTTIIGEGISHPPSVKRGK